MLRLWIVSVISLKAENFLRINQEYIPTIMYFINFELNDCEW